jgi:hypothetical protein
MALGWSHAKETPWIHGEVGTRLEPSGGLKARLFRNTWKGTVEEEGMERG